MTNIYDVDLSRRITILVFHLPMYLGRLQRLGIETFALYYGLAIGRYPVYLLGIGRILSTPIDMALHPGYIRIHAHTNVFEHRIRTNVRY
jgi:hypothetical protein